MLDRLIREYFGSGPSTTDKERKKKMLDQKNSYKLLKSLGIKCNKKFFQQVIFA